MLDIRFIRENPDKVSENAKQKGYKVNINELLMLDDSRREVLSSVELLRKKRNENSQKMKGAKPSDELIKEGREIKEKLAGLETELRERRKTK